MRTSKRVTVRESLAAAAAGLAGSSIGSDESSVRALVAAAAAVAEAIDSSLPAQVSGAIAELNWSDAESLHRGARFVRAAGVAADEHVRAFARRRGRVVSASLLPIVGALHVLLGSAQRAMLRRARELEGAGPVGEHAA